VTDRSVTHATIVVERTYDASPARVFAAWADPVAKARWFASPEEWGPDEFELDFRVGGREINRGGPKGGPVYTYDARYQDIVADERIVYTYSMHLDKALLSISVAPFVLSKAVLPHMRAAGTGRSSASPRSPVSAAGPMPASRPRALRVRGRPVR
jgi:uncharacterized protein YndB with AHSA1/START domain